jgi:hypothetical protein
MSWINILNVIYPVGSVYFSTINSSPAKTIGGTWQAISGLNLGTPTKTFGDDAGFGAWQLGDVVFFGGFGSRPALQAWSSTIGLDVNGKLPDPVGSGAANGGAIYSQNSSKSVWAYRNGSGNISFENKNSTATETWYYGSFAYQTTPENAITNNLGIYAWKRTA